MFVLDIELYLQGKVSTHTPLEIEVLNNSIWSVLIMMDCPRRFYFNAYGVQCDSNGTIVESPIYVLTRGLAS